MAYCTLLGVLWQMFHAWITYGTFRRTFQTLGKLGGTSGKYQDTCLFACFWNPYGSLAMLGLPLVVATTDQVTRGMISHVRLGCTQQTDTCDEHTDIQNTCDECMNCQNVHNECMNHQNMHNEHTNGLTPCMTRSNDQSDEHASNTNMHDDETT